MPKKVYSDDGWEPAKVTDIEPHSGGAPRTYDHDDIRAAAVIALVPHLKKGTIPKTYSGNDLVAEVKLILGDVPHGETVRIPGETLLKDILNPLLARIRNRLAGR